MEFKMKGRVLGVCYYTYLSLFLGSLEIRSLEVVHYRKIFSKEIKWTKWTKKTFKNLKHYHTHKKVVTRNDILFNFVSVSFQWEQHRHNYDQVLVVLTILNLWNFSVGALMTDCKKKDFANKISYHFNKIFYIHF